MIRRTSTCFAVFSLLLGVIGAHAREPGVFVTQLLGQHPGPGKTFACFARAYDDAHRASHPAQNVTFMEVLVTNYAGKPRSYQLRMGFRFAGRPETLTTVAECGSRDPVNRDGTARCAGPSEGQTELRVDGRNALIVTLPTGIHLWKPGPPDPQHTIDDAFGADDILFRLERAPPSRCIDQAFEYEKRLPSRQF